MSLCQNWFLIIIFLELQIVWNNHQQNISRYSKCRLLRIGEVGTHDVKTISGFLWVVITLLFFPGVPCIDIWKMAGGMAWRCQQVVIWRFGSDLVLKIDQCVSWLFFVCSSSWTHYSTKLQCFDPVIRDRNGSCSKSTSTRLPSKSICRLWHLSQRPWVKPRDDEINVTDEI